MSTINQPELNTMTTCRKRTREARAITLQRRAQRRLKYGRPTTTDRKAR